MSTKASPALVLLGSYLLPFFRCQATTWQSSKNNQLPDWCELWVYLPFSMLYWWPYRNSFLSHCHHALCDWQCLTGHINWLFNVLPWGCPALTKFYCKISGKRHQYSLIPLNRTIIEDLSWLHTIIPKSIRIRFVDADLWNDCDTDFVVWTDASLTALAFVYASVTMKWKLRCAQPPKLGVCWASLAAPRGARPASVALGDNASKWGEEKMY